MIVGEDKNKVFNIVKPLMPQFRALYAQEIAKMSEFLWFNSDKNIFIQDVSPNGRHFHLSMLPKKMQVFLVKVRQTGASFTKLTYFSDIIF
jgi:hypothetical protein